MLSFSVPLVTCPVLPAWRMVTSSPEPPSTVAAPLPVDITSLPPSPTIVPGPVSAD